MSSLSTWTSTPVLVVGAGIMGAGIAQVAAKAGHTVFLFDLREGAAANAKGQLAQTLKGLVAKGRMTKDEASGTLSRIVPTENLSDASSALLAVEAIVEEIGAKRSLMRSLEDLLPANAILATNTSSISVTAIANGLQHPERVVGMHFFNPVPLMRLVEVVRGLQTAEHVTDTVYALAKHWGKVPVHAKSTPGFIVNRIARPFYAETLAVLQEQGAKPHELDACIVAAGFRMGPCALMDLIGHDTNFAVTSSVYAANFYDKRFVPSILQKELVDGGLLGRKTGQGFYHYIGIDAGAPALPASQVLPFTVDSEVIVHGTGAKADWLAETAVKVGGQVHRSLTSTWVGLSWDGFDLAMTDGRCASELASIRGKADLAVFDRFEPARVTASQPLPLAYAVPESAKAAVQQIAERFLSALGFRPVLMKDLPGLVVARTLAMLVNEASDAVAQGVCDEAGADSAMKLGVNYPKGPFEWLADWHADSGNSASAVVSLLDSLDANYRGERYRVSPWLRAKSLCASLVTQGAE